MPCYSGNSAAAGAAGAAAGGGALSGFGQWWNHITNKHVPAVQHHVNNVATHVRSRAQTVKWSMPVDVKVDFLRPTIETVKESAITIWYQLPPPVQQAAPFVGVAMGSGLVVFLIQQRRLNHVRARNEELKVQVGALSKERQELIKRINLLKVKSGGPRTDVEARLAAAVAEATNAAASAADAAARAATACIFRPEFQQRNQ